MKFGAYYKVISDEADLKAQCQTPCGMRVRSNAYKGGLFFIAGQDLVN
ncbi:hypothetical protein B0I26_10515 [Anoxybacillus vitaminiphilus]|uniref:Uncharacterized protein n=1 Tax=Paranoxybacillus vitaminiphilus TaxID=581036 RepID=A0A327YG62_9BACL|nr:hypothetical protein B0I26_10515 [Anoxybacillus vitaminiphilus]